MGFVKVQKTKPYFKRFQVKYRRRREGKTDYYQRKKLTIQAKNKYASPKYRLVVRFTNTQCICQIVYATIQGDKILASAYSPELKRYGLPCGYNNYASAYATGLLVGRRVLTKLGLAEAYTGVGNDEEDEVTGEIMTTTDWNKRTYFVDELDDDRKPFRCNLDVGLARTSLGAKVFGALKGASDAGLDIPHNYKKFPGYDADEKEYDVDMHKEKIFGGDVAEFMRFLEDEDSESGTNQLGKQFKCYVDAGINADDLEEIYEKVHKAIREDPSPKHAESRAERSAKATHDKKWKKPNRRTYEERKAAVEARKEELGMNAESSEEEESEEEDEE